MKESCSSGLNCPLVSPVPFTVGLALFAIKDFADVSKSGVSRSDHPGIRAISGYPCEWRGVRHGGTTCNPVPEMLRQELGIESILSCNRVCLKRQKEERKLRYTDPVEKATGSQEVETGAIQLLQEAKLQAEDLASPGLRIFSLKNFRIQSLEIRELRQEDCHDCVSYLVWWFE